MHLPSERWFQSGAEPYRRETSGVLFQAGSAEAEAFASVEEGDDIFPGSDFRTIQITQA
jgi:hypothetical protein